MLWRREKGTQQTLATVAARGAAPLDLRVTATGGSRFQFAMSADGKSWEPIGGETGGGYLPPWDLAVRIALAAGGAPGAQSRFDWIRIDTR